MQLAAIPRPSHHEEEISQYLMSWAEEMGFEPRQDEAMNICFDVPAGKGMEDYPLVALQGHMDMVVAVADGRSFDPLTDPIRVIRSDEDHTLTADGTSLGADDGSGVALIMAAAQGMTAHGPLRVIITVDEEDGMEGAFRMSDKWLDGVSYLINIDNECSDEVLVSTAAGDSVKATAAAEYRDAFGDLALTAEISGLVGGHSGIMIGEGRCNGIIALARFLKALGESGVSFELAGFSGGSASNAIPTRAVCTIVIDRGDMPEVTAQAAAFEETLREEYAGIEDGFSLQLTAAESLPRVVSDELRDSFIRFMTEIIDGVYTMSTDMEGLVESSSNLGLASLDAEGVFFSTYIRSSVAELEAEIKDTQLRLAESCGLDTKIVKMADPWPFDPDSRLLALTEKTYRELNGEEIKVVAIHAGLECGTFKLLNPDVDMISIGPDIADAHTVNETLYLDSVPKLWNLVSELLVRVGSVA